jgi:hypothetical protein
MDIAQALEEIHIAISHFVFTIKLLSYCEGGNLNPKDFDTDHIVRLQGGTLRFPTGAFNDTKSLIHEANIGVLIAFSASVLALDKGFEVAGIKSDAEAKDNIGRLRTLIYMLRCAEAHGIADPHWEARGNFARSFRVDLDGTQISLDFKALHGQRFHIDQLGGYVNWWRICAASLEHLEKLSP